MPAVAAGSPDSPWSGITERVPNFWGWVVLLVAVLLVVALVWRATKKWERRTRRQRVMPLHWRLRLHRHPGHGFASLRELVVEYGLRRARKDARRLYPALAARYRRMPATAAGIRLGRAPNFPHRPAWAGPEESVLYIAPPRSGKSGEVANQVLDAPGAVLVTSSRRDIVDLTASIRAQRGPVWVFDPQECLGPRSPWPLVYWSPIAGCEHPAVAMFRARALAAAADTDGVTNSGFWQNTAARALRALLHAAAVGEHTMMDVAQWVATGSDAPVRTLRANPDRAAAGWAEELEEIIALGSKAEATQASLTATLGNALDFLAHPGLASTCGGTGRGGGFDVETWLREGGTLYMLAAQGDEGKLVAPVFSGLAAECHARGLAYAQQQGQQRLDPPASLILDESPTICPVALPDWSATAAGSGYRLVAAAQALSQLADRWGEKGAATIWSNFTTTVIWGGVRNHEEREEISRLAGDADFWYEPVNVSHDYGGKRHFERNREWRREPIIRPDEVRRLPKRYALVISRTAAPTIVRTRGAWLRRSVRAALKRPMPGRYERAAAPQPVVQDQPATGDVRRRPTDAPDLPIGGHTAPQPAVGGPETTDATASTDSTQQGDQSMKLSDADLAALLAGEIHERAKTDGPEERPDLGRGWGPPPPRTDGNGGSGAGGGLPEPPWGRPESYPWERRDGDT